MKKSFTTFCTCKSRRALAALAVLLTVACTKDPMTDLGPAGRSLRFEISQDEGWHTPQSRATAGDAEPTTLRVIPLQDETADETLYLHVSVADGIHTSVAASENDAPQTRATLVEDMSQITEFAVDGYSYEPGTWSASLTPNLMQVYCVEEGNGIWKPSDRDYYWPGPKKKVRFFAYAPGSLEDLRQGNPQSITYNGTYRLLDTDWLFADTGELPGDMSAPVPLTFRHMLSCVKFVTGDDMMAGKITQIAFTNHYRDAVFSFGAGTWSELTTCASQRLTTDWETDGTAEAELGSVFLIPQVFPDDAQLVVNFTDALTSKNRTLRASLAGLELPMGKTLTVRLSTSSIQITSHLVINWINDFTYNGGMHQYGVSSYREVTGDDGVATRVPAAWTAEFSTDDGQTWTAEKPEWVTSFTTQGPGGYNATRYYARAAAQQGVNENPHNDALLAAAPVSGTYNLSNATGADAVENTANCYLINAPGTYSLPLVYGNAVKNGVENPSAYTSSIASGNYALERFVNHLDAGITDPYIYNNAGCTPADAVLVWQDEENLVTNVALTADQHSLTFEVGAATIRQGNAIVAVRDAQNRIMWSWHIWVTDYRLGDDIKTVTNYQGTVYDFMPVNIGWCDDGITTWDARSVKVRFTQTETGKSEIVTLNQSSYASVGGNNPYYQWGRKDPMLPGIRTESGATEDKRCYSAAYAFDKVAGPVSIGTSIQHPHISYPHSVDWCDANATVSDKITFCNLWSADNRLTSANDYAVVKTIYDPSPAGYHLPTSAACTGFTNSGEGVSGSYYGTRFNSPWTSAAEYEANFGFEFYCNKMNGVGNYDPSGGTIFFPASGYRSYQLSTAAAVGGVGYCWLAHPKGLEQGYDFCFSSTSIYTNNGHIRACGFAARAVRE